MKRSHLAVINLRSRVADTGMHGGGKEERAGGQQEGLKSVAIKDLLIRVPAEPSLWPHHRLD